MSWARRLRSAARRPTLTPWTSTVAASLQLIDELDQRIGDCERDLHRFGVEHRYVPQRDGRIPQTLGDDRLRRGVDQVVEEGAIA